MSDAPKRIHLVGFGNPGRLDDGLGPALAAAIEELQLPNVSVDSDYQLTVDDAHDVAPYDVVVFADADVRGREPFYFESVEVGEGISFSSHGCSPSAVVSLARELFGGPREAYLIGMRGYEWDAFEERLSEKARENLEEAIQFLKKVFQSGDFAGSVIENDVKAL